MQIPYLPFASASDANQDNFPYTFAAGKVKENN